MAISAAFGMGVVGTNQGNVRRQPHAGGANAGTGAAYPSTRIQVGRVARLVGESSANPASARSNNASASHGDTASLMEAPLSEHMDFLPHGYAKDTVFRFKNPLVTDILQNDINAKQCDFTLVSDAKASIKGAASSRSDDSHPGSRGRGRSGSGSGRSSSTSPAIGGLRRLMKRTHTPEGLVTYYENRLRAFLDLDSNADSTDGRASETDGNQQNGSAAGPCSSAGDSDWQIIDEDEGMFTPMDRDQLIEEDDMVVLTQALAKIEQSPSRPSPAIKAGINQNLVTEWAIPDSFTRLIVHTMCRYYGLVSFSENAADGENVLHICHPRFFKDAETISVPDVTFHQFLYNSN